MRSLSNNKGFTLVEVMVALLITGILMVIVFRFVFDQMHGYQRETMVSDAQQNLRATMDAITRDIRMAGSGIPAVPIYTGNTTLADDSIYPLFIISGTTLSASNTANQMFILTGNAATNVNDSIICIYKNADQVVYDTTLTASMTVGTDAIVIPNSAVGGFIKNTPFIVTDAAGTKADLYITTDDAVAGSFSASESALPHVATAGVYAMYNTVTVGNGIGHDRNFNMNASAGAAVLGYRPGDKVFPVRVVRYDWSYDLASDNFPITRLVNADTERATNDAVGEFFGSSATVPVVLSGANANQAIDIQYAPFYGTGSSVTFSAGMPVNPYNIGVVRVTLTARTAVKGNNYSNISMFRTRTLTTDVQLRNYGQ